MRTARIKPLAVWAIAGLIAIGVSSIPTCSQAAEPLVAQWDVANDNCRGGNVAAQVAKDCKTRDGLTLRLKSHGYVQGNHEEWFTPIQYAFFQSKVSAVGGQLADAIALNAVDTLVPNLYSDLRQQLTDVEIVGLYAATQDKLRRFYPDGYVIMRALAVQIARYHSQSHDVRFNLD